jgi:hypothetical protein
MQSPRFSINGEDWISILKGAAINVGGTILLTVGQWLTAGGFSLETLKIALGANLGAVLVNIARKFLSSPAEEPHQ